MKIECPQGKFRFHFSLQSSHSSKHFLPHLWSFLQPFLIRPQSFLHRYSSWSGSVFKWHLRVQVWPHSSRTSQGSGQRASVGSSPQSISTRCSHGSRHFFGTRHLVFDGSTKHSITDLCPHSNSLSIRTKQGPQGSKHCFLQRWPSPHKTFSHGLVHLKPSVDLPHSIFDVCWQLARTFSTFTRQ